MSSTIKHKRCFVPGCASDSRLDATKIFITLPHGKDIRKKWAEAVGRTGASCSFSASSPIFCCEDHFNLPEDVENWIKYKLMKGRIYLKKGVLPHIFKGKREQITDEPNSLQNICSTSKVMNNDNNRKQGETEKMITDEIRYSSMKLDGTHGNTSTGVKVHSMSCDLNSNSNSSQGELESIPSTRNAENVKKSQFNNCSKKVPYKKCFVPGCPSDSRLDSTKIFVILPYGTDIRKKWAEAVGRTGAKRFYSAYTSVYCCEDHFNLPEDAENWIKYKLTKGRIIIKEGILPRVFKAKSEQITDDPSPLQNICSTSKVINNDNNQKQDETGKMVTDNISYSTMKLDGIHGGTSTGIEKCSMSYDLNSDSNSSQGELESISSTRNAANFKEGQFNNCSKKRSHSPIEAKLLVPTSLIKITRETSTLPAKINILQSCPVTPLPANSPFITTRNTSSVSQTTCLVQSFWC